MRGGHNQNRSQVKSKARVCVFSLFVGRSRCLHYTKTLKEVEGWVDTKVLEVTSCYKPARINSQAQIV